MLDEVDFPPKIRGRVFELRTVTGPPIEVGSTTVTPLAKVVAVKGAGCVIFRSYPTAVQVSANGQVSRIRVRDMTRVAQAVVGLLNMFLIFYLVIRALRRKETRS